MGSADDSCEEVFMKKLGIGFLCLMVLVGCTPSTDSNDQSNEIKVYTRDSSSGTRDAFESIIGLETLTDNSAETTGNGDMAKQVGSTQSGIGYVSLSTDFEANGIKPVSYEGVQPTVDTVNAGTYKLARPFGFVTRASGDFESDAKQALVAAVIDYMVNSIEGRQVILASGGIVDVSKGTPWATLKVNHPIVNQDNSGLTLKIGGSTSVEKTLTAVIESFIPMAGGFKYEPNLTGSGDGFKRVLGGEKDGANGVDIGFASRNFNETETVEDALLTGVYALDAVVVVVAKDNAISDLSALQLVDIFSGKTTDWNDIN